LKFSIAVVKALASKPSWEVFGVSSTAELYRTLI
jgi:hypothetical protein